MFKSKRLVLITYSSITSNGKEILVNSAFGKFTDSLAAYFKDVIFIGAEAESNSNLYIEGKSIYSYMFQSKNIKWVSINSTHSVSNFIKRLIIILKNQLIINKEVKDADYVYIYLPSYTGLLAAFFCIVKKKNYFAYVGSNWAETGILRVPGNNNFRYIYNFAVKFYLLFELFVLKKCLFCLVAGSTLLNIYKKKISRVYETIPAVQFLPSDRRYVDDTKQLSKNKITSLLFVGNVKRTKGIDTLIRAIHILLQRCYKLKLNVIGTWEKDYLKTVQNEIELYNLENHVCIHGYINDVEKLEAYYINSDILVLPTLGEGFPRVVYEAMLVGLPVVSSDISSIKILEDLQIATLVRPSDSHGFAKGIQDLIDDKDLYEKRRKAAYIFASSKFYEDPATQVIDLLNNGKNDF